MRLKGKTALITGAASGMGAATAILFAKEGAAVVACDLNKEALDRVVEDVRGLGGEIIPLVFDVAEEEECQKAVETAVQRYGALDILVTCPWWHPFKTLLDTETAEWKRTLDVTLSGVFYCCKYAVEAMLKEGSGGSIINISSVEATSAAFRAAAYMTAKAGVNQLTRSIAMDYGSEQIRANVISPGAIATPPTVAAFDAKNLWDTARAGIMLNRIGKPEEVAQAALFLASDDSSYMTGVDLVVDGGLTGRI